MVLGPRLGSELTVKLQMSAGIHCRPGARRSTPASPLPLEPMPDPRPFGVRWRAIKMPIDPRGLFGERDRAQRSAPHRLTAPAIRIHLIRPISHLSAEPCNRLWSDTPRAAHAPRSPRRTHTSLGGYCLVSICPGIAVRPGLLRFRPSSSLGRDAPGNERSPPVEARESSRGPSVLALAIGRRRTNAPAAQRAVWRRWRREPPR